LSAQDLCFDEACLCRFRVSILMLFDTLLTYILRFLVGFFLGHLLFPYIVILLHCDIYEVCFVHILVWSICLHYFISSQSLNFLPETISTISGSITSNPFSFAIVQYTNCAILLCLLIYSVFAHSSHPPILFLAFFCILGKYFLHHLAFTVWSWMTAICACNWGGGKFLTYFILFSRSTHLKTHPLIWKFANRSLILPVDGT